MMTSIARAAVFIIIVTDIMTKSFIYHQWPWSAQSGSVVGKPIFGPNTLLLMQ